MRLILKYFLLSHLVRFTDLAEEVWVSQPVGTAQHEFLVGICLQAGFRPAIRYLASSEDATRKILHRKGCVTIGSPLMTDPQCCIACPLDVEVTRRMLFAWDPATCQELVAQGLLDAVRSWYREMAGRNPAYWESIVSSSSGKYDSVLAATA